MRAKNRARLLDSSSAASSPHWSTSNAGPRQAEIDALTFSAPESAPESEPEPAPEPASAPELDESAGEVDHSDAVETLLGGNVGTIRRLVRQGDSDAYLVPAREAEQAAQGRKTVIRAIDARLQTLNGVKSP
jgi:hypothetical protein